MVVIMQLIFIFGVVLCLIPSTIKASDSSPAEDIEVPQTLYELTQGDFTVSAGDYNTYISCSGSFAKKDVSLFPMLTDLLSIGGLFSKHAFKWRGRDLMKHYFSKSTLSDTDKQPIQRLCSPSSYWQKDECPKDINIAIDDIKKIHGFQFAGRLAYELNLLFTKGEQRLLLDEDQELGLYNDITNPHRFYRGILEKFYTYQLCQESLAEAAGIKIILKPENFLLYHVRCL